MNNAFIIQQAKAFAKRLRTEAGENAGAQVDRAYQLALARPPSRFEREKAVEFIGSGPRGSTISARRVQLQRICVRQ